MADRIFTYLVVATPGEPEQIVVWDTLDVSVGRVPGQDVVLDDPEVSRAHALFAIEGDGYVVADQRTANGTFVNGVRIATHALRPGDEVQLGQTVIRFRQEAESPMGKGARATFASQLKGFGTSGSGADEGGRTMLGVAPSSGAEGMDEAASDLGPVGEAQFDLGGGEVAAPPSPVARDLDEEIAEDSALSWDDSILGMEPLEPPPKREPAAEAPIAPPVASTPARSAPAPAPPAAVEEDRSARVNVGLEITGPKGPLVAVVTALLDREISIPPFKLRLRKTR